MFQSLEQISIGDLFVTWVPSYVTWEHISGLVTDIVYTDDGKPGLIIIGAWSDNPCDRFEYTLDDLNRHKDEYDYYPVKK